MPQGTIHDRWVKAAGILLVLLFGLSWSLQRPGPCNEAIDGLHTQGKVSPPCLFLTESKDVVRKLDTGMRGVVSEASVTCLPEVSIEEYLSFPLTWEIPSPSTPERESRSWRGPPSHSSPSA